MVKSVVARVRGRVMRSPAIVLVGVLAAALLLMVVGTVPEKADAAPKFRIVTRTFSNPTPILIPSGAPTIAGGAAAPYPSVRSVLGFRRGKILDVNLTLRNFSHTFEEDVDVLVVKGATSRTVMSDVDAASPPTNVTIVLDDEAAIPLGSAVFASGTFKPRNFDTPLDPVFDPFPAPAPTASGASALSGFDGTNPNGTWRLFVVDDAVPESGQFAGGWSLTIRARVVRQRPARLRADASLHKAYWRAFSGALTEKIDGEKQ